LKDIAPPSEMKNKEQEEATHFGTKEEETENTTFLLVSFPILEGQLEAWNYETQGRSVVMEKREYLHIVLCDTVLQQVSLFSQVVER